MTENISLKRNGPYYELTLPPLLIEAEIVLRKVFKLLEEDEAADLTNPHTLNRIIEQVSKPSNWVDLRLHVMFAPPLLNTPASAPSPVVPTLPTLAPSQQTDISTKQRKGIGQEREALMRKRAQVTAPYLWLKECRTPIPPLDWPSAQRKKILHDRDDEKVVLAKLLTRWQEGRFPLTAEAAEAQKRYEADQVIAAEAAERLKQEQAEGVQEKVEAIATALKQNGIH